MTPKEKAKELFYLYYMIRSEVVPNKKYAKQCALIAVNEICTQFHPVKYWDQVKIELEKL